MKLTFFRTTTPDHAAPVAGPAPEPVETTAPAGPAVPAEPADLLVRLHNQVGAAVDITGNEYGYQQGNTRWHCHGCGESSGMPEQDWLPMTRRTANQHAATCRAVYHRCTR